MQLGKSLDKLMQTLMNGILSFIIHVQCPQYAQQHDGTMFTYMAAVTKREAACA